MADDKDEVTPAEASAPAPDTASVPAPDTAGAPVIDTADAILPPGSDGTAAVAPDEVLGADEPGAEEVRTESVNEPAKVMRIGSMVKTLLDEVRAAPLDEKSRVRLREIYEQSIQDLSEGLSPDLVAELKRMTPPFDVEAPSDAELRIAQAQLVGWLEGLFHGIQATLDVPADGGPGPARGDAQARASLGRRDGSDRRLPVTRSPTAPARRHTRSDPTVAQRTES